MNSASELGSTFIVPNVTALAFAQIMNMGDTGPWETDWIVISSEESTGPGILFTLSHALRTFPRDKIVTQFRLTQNSYPD